MGLYQNRIVVKVGTSTLTNEMGKSDLRSFDRLACVLSDIQNMGYEVILVSSGAIFAPDLALGELSPLRIHIRQQSCATKKEGANMAEEQAKTLRDVKIGDTATVRRLTGEGALKRHIMDMGITKGVEVYVRKVAPLGDPIEVTVRGYELSLRKSEAESILVN